MGLSLVTVTFLIACSHWEPVHGVVAPVIEAILGHTVYSDGLHWDVDSGMLYFVDIFGKSVYRFDSNSTIVTYVYLGEIVTIVIPIRGEADKFVITLGDKIAVLAWDGESTRPTFVKVLGAVGRPHDTIYANDGKADANGILWAGTLVLRGGKFDYVPDAGVLFSFSKWRIPKIHAKGMTASNGITWNVNNTQLYLADIAERVVYAFDFDLFHSSVGNPRVIFNFKHKEIDGYPGGITIDCDDRLWVACIGAGQIINIDPTTGELLRTVSIPSIFVTSVSFGGCNMDELYVTSSTMNVLPKDLHKYPAPGCVFRVTGLGARGLPPNRVSL